MTSSSLSVTQSLDDEPLWTRQPSSLFDLGKLWPLDLASRSRQINFASRVAVVVCVASVCLKSRSRIWLYCVAFLLVVYLFAPAWRLSDEETEAFDLTDVLDQAQSAVDAANEAPPTPPSVAEERQTRQEQLEQLETKAKRGAKIKAQYLKALWADDKNRALGFIRNPREATSRGDIVWSREQRIYSNRSFVKPSSDEYGDLLDTNVGPTKYLSRRV